MKTLFDGIQNVDKTEAVDQLAELATNNADTYVNVLLSNIKSTINAFFALFIPGLAEKSDHLKSDSIKDRYEKKQNEYAECSMSELKEECKILLKKAVRGNDIQSDDELLASVTRKAARILSKKDIEGKSVYEINDLLFRKYPDLEKPDFDNLLLGLLIGETAFLFALLLAIIYWDLSGLLFVIIFFPIQPLIFNGVRTRLLSWKLARFVWLSGSGAGGFNESKGKLPLDLINNKTRDNLLLEVRTIHNLWKSVNNLVAEKEEINRSISAIEGQMISNNKIISENNSAIGRSDSIRIIEDKKIENATLTTEKAALRQSLENKTLDLEKNRKLLQAIETDVSKTVYRMWKKIFSKAEFTRDFIFDLIRKFSLEDFSLVEKRIFEVCNTTSPKSLAKRTFGGYSLSFMTNNQDLATLMFSLDKASAVTFFKIDRAVPLQETPLSREELEQVMGKYDKSETAKNRDLLTEYEKQMMELQKRREAWEGERQELEHEAIAFENDKEKLLSDLKFSYDKIDDLQNQIVAREKDSEILSKQLKKAMSESESEELNQSLAEQREALTKLESELQEKIAENTRLLENLEYVNQQKAELKQACEKQEQEINEHEQLNSALINNIEKTNEAIRRKEVALKQKDSDINLKAGLLKKMEAKKTRDREFIQKLKNDIALLQKEKKELEESIQSKRKSIDAVEQDLDKYENFFEDEKVKLAKLKSEINGITAKILTNQGIYDQMYLQIKAAQKSIYIVAPFMKAKPFNRMLNNLESAVIDNPELKVKVLFGMNRRSGKDHEAEFNTSEDEYKKASELELRLGKNAISKRGHTHAKMMIFDDKSFILGSANAMSFEEIDPMENEETGVENDSDEAGKDELAGDTVIADKDLDNEVDNPENASVEVALFSTDTRICQQLKRQYFDW